MVNQQKVALLIALAAPTLLVVLVLGSIFIPQLFVSSKVGFLYFTGDDYSCSGQYVVENKKVAKGVDPFGDNTSSSYCKKADIYLHDSDKNESVKLSFEQAGQYVLDSNLKSKDGFEVVRGSSSGGFPFGGYSDNYKNYYFKGKGLSKKLNVNYYDSGYRVDYFNFLGWVEE